MPIVNSGVIESNVLRSPLIEVLEDAFIRGSTDFFFGNGNGASQGAIASEPGASGIWRLQTNTNANGSALIRSEFAIPAQQSWMYGATRFRIPVLPSSTERFQLWIGLVNGDSGSFNNGVFFFMDEGSSSRFSTLARNAGTQETAYSNQTPVISANVWYTAEIQIDRNGRYTYWLRAANNETILYTRTSTLHSPALGSGLGMMVWIYKTGGNTDRIVHLDSMMVRADLRT